MKKFKSKKPQIRDEVWVSEILLNSINSSRQKKVDKLISLLKEDFYNEEIS